MQPGLTEETRRAIGEAAVRAARAVSYVGAGELTISGAIYALYLTDVSSATGTNGIKQINVSDSE